jgi:hypothetical protein
MQLPPVSIDKRILRRRPKMVSGIQIVVHFYAGSHFSAMIVKPNHLGRSVIVTPSPFTSGFRGV